jgi:predicted HAD superfamily Cof-like phosphohydrolase
MSTNFKQTADWLKAAGKEVSNEQHISTQIGVDLEETAEFLREISIESKTGLSSFALQEIAILLDAIGKTIKLGHATAKVYDREAALDALCDREVTGNGVAYLLGMDKDGADQEVLRSNNSKLNEDGTAVILEGGKIGKSERYTPPNLTPFI